MNKQTANILNEINAHFYQCVHESFSATRSSAWEGWSKLLEVIDWSQVETIVDVACGNMRFERHVCDWFEAGCGEAPVLMSQPPGETSVPLALQCDKAPVPLSHAIDNCDVLAQEVPGVVYHHYDFVTALLDGANMPAELGIPSCDLAVSFGFMHHIPGFDWRCRALRSLASFVRPGGQVVVSLWRFMDDPRLAKKAGESLKGALEKTGLTLADLEEGDCFLGWQDRADVYRYCHHFSDEEIERMLAEVGDCLQVHARFRADGRSGMLNEYLVLNVVEDGRFAL